MYIHVGKVYMELEDTLGRGETRILEPGQSIHLPPFTKHRLLALEDTTLFEVSTPELDDVTRLADDYGRK
jgi:quercetin dioxygenase-like cupin family protein